MKITLLLIGKTSFPFVKEGLEFYEKRLTHYINFQRVEIPDIKATKNFDSKLMKEKEGELILKQIKPTDTLILLDERGAKYKSIFWAKEIEKKMITSAANLVFVVGGAYGFSDKVYQRANEKLSLSDMTFSHQIIRLFFLEQLYRAFTIIKGEPYHNE